MRQMLAPALILLGLILVESYFSKGWSSDLDNAEEAEIYIAPPLSSPLASLTSPFEPTQLLEELTKRPMPPIAAPSTKIGRYSLGCYLGCIEFSGPWLRCVIPPVIALGVVAGTTTAIINILQTCNLMDSEVASGIAAGCAIGVLVTKASLALAYSILEWGSAEANQASLALQKENNQLITLVEGHTQKIFQEKIKKWRLQERGEEEVLEKTKKFVDKFLLPPPSYSKGFR